MTLCPQYITNTHRKNRGNVAMSAAYLQYSFYIRRQNCGNSIAAVQAWLVIACFTWSIKRERIPGYSPNPFRTGCTS